MDAAETVIRMRQVCTRFGNHVVHRDLDLDVRRGEIFAIVGGSGSGKTVLLREIILLQKPTSGVVEVLGQDVTQLSAEQAFELRKRWGVMFQHGGLFSALTVRENVGLPLREYSRLDDALIDALAEWKLALTGLPPDAGLKFPGELSGGMLKRPVTNGFREMSSAQPSKGRLRGPEVTSASMTLASVTWNWREP